MSRISHSARFRSTPFLGLTAQVAILAVVAFSVCGPANSDSMATGSYTGNGSSQSVVTPGLTPEIVIVKGDTTYRAVMRTDTMSDSKDLASFTGLQSNCITGLTSTGFNVGSDSRVNRSGTKYYWVALNAEGLEAETGSYTGNGSSPRDITTVFSPMYVIVLPESTTYAIHRSTTMSAGYKFSSGSGYSNSIMSLGANKFAVGSNLNVTDVTYHYVAFKPTSGKMTVGLYLGNGQDDRQITGLGFQPEYMIIKCSSRETAHRPASLTGDAYFLFTNVAKYNNGIQELLSDGFELGSSVFVNEDLQLCHYVAFGSTYTAVEMSSLSATGLADEVVVEWETDAELGTAGFNVLRAEVPEGPWVRLNGELIPSRGNSWQGASYAFTDGERQPGAVRWYCVEEVDLGGSASRFPIQLVWDEGLADEDGDGMPDAWEDALGIDTGSPEDAAADADGDGATNLIEYLAGTSPVDPEDCPELTLKCPKAGGAPVLTWRARAGRTYKLVTADSLVELLSGSSAVICVVPATSDNLIALKGLPGEGKRRGFYRLIVSPPQ